MTVTISTPSGVIYPNKPVTIYFEPRNVGATWVRVWCHCAPDGSRLADLVTKHRNEGTDLVTGEYYNRTRALIFEGRATDPWQTTFEKGGKYTLYLQEYERDEFGGGYAGAPANAHAETLIGAEQTQTINVAQQVSQKIGFGNHTATLSFWALDDLILASPEPELTGGSSDIARSAIASTAVTNAVAALVGADLTHPTTTGDMSTWSGNLYAAINSHLDSSGVHFVNDTDNTLTGTYSTTRTAQAMIDFVNAALLRLRQHVTNDDGSGPSSAAYHSATDNAAVSIYTGVRTLAEAYGALADLSRCFDAHQRNETVHDVAGIYPVSELPLIQKVHSAFLAFVADPTEAPPAQSDGVQTLIAMAGFVEAPR